MLFIYILLKIINHAIGIGLILLCLPPVRAALHVNIPIIVFVIAYVVYTLIRLLRISAAAPRYVQHSEDRYYGPGSASAPSPSRSYSMTQYGGSYGGYDQSSYDFSPPAGDFSDHEDKLDIRRVQFSAISPQSIEKGDYAVIDIAMYEAPFRGIVREIMKTVDYPVKEKISASSIRMESNVMIRLTSPDLEIEDNEIEQQWMGEYLIYSFAVQIPEDYSKNKILFHAVVFENGIMRTRMIFSVNCSEAAQELTVFRKDIMSAFMSYASEDRARVASIAQGIKAICPDLDLFLDVNSLKTGEDWEQAIYREIEKRDMLFLCWSSNAKRSEWVEKEWRYALKTKGLDYIEPVPLELPDECPPPSELHTKHFSSNLLYIISKYDRVSGDGSS